MTSLIICKKLSFEYTVIVEKITPTVNYANCSAFFNCLEFSGFGP